MNTLIAHGHLTNQCTGSRRSKGGPGLRSSCVLLKMKFWKKQVIDTLSVSHEERRSLVSKGDLEGGVLKQTQREIRYYCCRDYFPCFPARYIFSIMGCFGFLIVYALRVNMSVALVAMVNESASSERPDKRGSSNDSATFSSCQPTAPVFDWGPAYQGGWMQLQAVPKI